MERDSLVLTLSSSVYPPAEDSFLLVKHSGGLKGRILEIGCGCGVVSLENAKINPKNEVIGVDINPEAVRCSKTNAKRNGIKNARFFKSDLFSAISPSEKFDAILFNPPYLPTSKKEKLSGALNTAFDGGRSGRSVFGRFLKKFSKYLKPGGTLLLIHSSLNNFEKTKKTLSAQGFKVETLETQHFFFEKLYVLKITHT